MEMSIHDAGNCIMVGLVMKTELLSICREGLHLGMGDVFVYCAQGRIKAKV